MRRAVFIAALAAVLVVITATVFAVAVTDGQLHMDDWGYTYGCRFVRDGLSIANLRMAFADLANGAIWMPLTYASYMLDISVFGPGFIYHHAVNVALHCWVSVLVFAWLRRLLRYFGSAETAAIVLGFVGALLWAVHPLRAEAVVWVASRKEMLWTLFALWGLLVWWNYLEQGGARRYVLTLVLFLLALLAKPTAMCFPFLALALHCTLLRSCRRPWIAYLPMFMLATATVMLGIYSQSHPTGLDITDVNDTDLSWRLLNAAVSAGLIIYHSVIPTGLHIFYRAVPGGWPLGSLLGLSTLTASFVVWMLIVVMLPKTRRAAALSAAWFILALLPALGILAINCDHAYADRYAYAPTIAMSMVAVIVLRPLFRSWMGRVSVGLAVVAFFGIELCVVRPLARSYLDDYSAFSRTLEYDPEHWRALRVVGCEYCAHQGKMDEGIELIRRSLRLHPTRPTLEVLVYSLAIRGSEADFAEINQLSLDVVINPKIDRSGMILDALGIVAMRKQDWAAAVTWYTAALAAPRRAHSSDHAVLNLGLAYANLGRRVMAFKFLNAARKSRNDIVSKRADSAVNELQAGNLCSFEWQE